MSEHPIITPFDVDPRVSPEVTAALLPDNIVSRRDKNAYDVSVHVVFDLDFGDMFSHRMKSTGTTTFCGKDPFDPTNPGVIHHDLSSTGRRACPTCKTGHRVYYAELKNGQHSSR